MKTRLIVGGLCALAAAAVVAASYVANVWAGGDPSELAGWLEATATLAAFTAAVIAAVLVGRTYRIESKREERLLNTDRSRQASLVAAWYVDYVPANASGEVYDEGPEIGIASIKVAIRNASEIPVQGVRVNAYLEVERSGDDGGPLIIRFQPVMPGTLAPGADGVVYIVPSSQVLYEWVRFSPQNKWAFRIAMEFWDAAGVRWLRDPIGRLHEISEGEDPWAGWSPPARASDD